MQFDHKCDLTTLYHYADAQDHQKLKKASELTFTVLDTICQFIKPGVKESEVLKHCYKVYDEFKIDRIWHKPIVRFGKNTITTFRDVPSDDLILTKEDIAFIDIGIVKDGIEGDAGRTLQFGNHSVHAEIAALTEELFHMARAHWKENNLTGVELYQYIEAQANARGFEWNLRPAGHLIGSFPHASAKYTNGLSHFPDIVQPYTWIVEIQIRHPTLELGGFFESILY